VWSYVCGLTCVVLRVWSYECVVLYVCGLVCVWSYVCRLVFACLLKSVCVYCKKMSKLFAVLIGFDFRFLFRLAAYF